MDSAFYDRLETDLAGLRDQGLYKTERLLGSPQSAVIRVGPTSLIAWKMTTLAVPAARIPE